MLLTNCNFQIRRRSFFQYVSWRLSSSHTPWLLCFIAVQNRRNHHHCPLLHKNRHSLGRFSLDSLFANLLLYICARFGFARFFFTLSNRDVMFVTMVETEEKCNFRLSQKVCKTHSIVLSIQTFELYCSRSWLRKEGEDIRSIVSSSSSLLRLWIIKTGTQQILT